MNFKNPIVRMWFYIILPTIILSVLLLIIFPLEYHAFVLLGKSAVDLLFLAWAIFYRKKLANLS